MTGKHEMKIVVLGSGAMGSLFGGYLSRNNSVWVVDLDKTKVDAINTQGVRILEKNGDVVLYPKAVMDTTGLGKMDLVIIFVKSLYSKDALESNKHLLDKNTYILSLQNGAGHEKLLRQYVKADHVIIGSTKDNSSIIGPGYVNHGASSTTRFGLLEGDSAVLQDIADNFTSCGFATTVSDNVLHDIWAKLFINSSASTVTAILQCSMDFLAIDPYGWKLTEDLAREAVAVANAAGQDFNADRIVAEIRALAESSRNAYTSIYVDIRDGRKCEVDTISGYVVSEAKRLNVPAPKQEFAVDTIHAMENKARA